MRENSFSNLYKNSNLKKTARIQNILKKGLTNNKENIIIEDKRKSLFIKNKKINLTCSLKLSDIRELDLKKSNKIVSKNKKEKKVIKKIKNKQPTKMNEINKPNILKSTSLDSKKFLFLKYSTVDDKKIHSNVENKNMKIKTKKIKNKMSSKINLEIKSKKSVGIKNTVNELKKSFDSNYFKRLIQIRRSLNKTKLILKKEKESKSKIILTDRENLKQVNKISSKDLQAKNIFSWKNKKKIKSVSINQKREFLNLKNSHAKKNFANNLEKLKEPFININFEKTKNIYFNLPSKNLEESPISNLKESEEKSNKILFSCAATDMGSVRKTNEDRISLLINVKYKNKFFYNFYGVYDGHAGSECSEYLKNNLHLKFIEEKNIFDDFEYFKKKTKIIFDETDKEFLKFSEEKSIRAGSCATIMMAFDRTLYLINTGDTRAISSKDGGSQTIILTQDHKPELELEKNRIFKNGGYLYTSSTHLIKNNEEKIVRGPIRVFPGRLTISRAFGDINAKIENYGGKSGVLIVDPDCYEYKVENVDFVVIGSDGLFESLTNEDIVSFIWKTIREVLEYKQQVFNKDLCDFVVKELITYAISKGSLDNISVILIIFENINFYLN
jgi:serine/threonine protein phosphatase PrpC